MVAIVTTARRRHGNVATTTGGRAALGRRAGAAMLSLFLAAPLTAAAADATRSDDGFVMHFTPAEVGGDRVGAGAKTFRLEADRKTGFTPRAAGLRPDRGEALDLLAPRLQLGRAGGIGVSRTVFDTVEFGLEASYQRLANLNGNLFSTTDGVGLDATVRYGGLSFGAGINQVVERGARVERFFERSLGDGYGAALSYDFGDTLVSVSGSRGRGGSSLLYDRYLQRDQLKLAGRYDLGTAMNLSASFAVSDAEKEKSRLSLPMFNDWALLTGFEWSF